MNGVAINHEKNNLEVMSKLMNSVCMKYECSVTYDETSNEVIYKGDESVKPFIVEETANIFNRS